MSSLVPILPMQSLWAMRALKSLVSFKLLEDLPGLISALLVRRRPPAFKFVEIGVFKGDNAVRTIRLAQRFTTNIFYIGFDLFEHQDEFYQLHPEERAIYDSPEYPYWEFQSGQHARAEIERKISSVLSQDNFVLIMGDSTSTVPAHRERLTDASVI